MEFSALVGGVFYFSVSSDPLADWAREIVTNYRRHPRLTPGVSLRIKQKTPGHAPG